MKRQPKKKYPIKKFWNLFVWEKCKAGNHEFVRMSGWRSIPPGMILLPAPCSGIVCIDCAATPEEAEKALSVRDVRLDLPPLQPKPPKPWEKTVAGRRVIEEQEKGGNADEW